MLKTYSYRNYGKSIARLILCFLTLLIPIVFTCSCFENKHLHDSSNSNCDTESETASLSDDGRPSDSQTYVSWNNGSGLSFLTDETYVVSGAINPEEFVSFLITIEISEEISSKRAGVLIGNYSGLRPCLNIEIVEGGIVRFYSINEKAIITDLLFNDARVPFCKKTQIALVDNYKKGRIECYIDGKMVQYINTKRDNSFRLESLIIGGDLRDHNEQFFKGSIYNVAVFNSILTSKEINNYSSGVNLAKRNVVFAYDFSGIDVKEGIFDLTKRFFLSRNSIWENEVEIPTDFMHSIAVVGDTQIITQYHPDKLHLIYDYIVNKTELYKTAYCIGLGDITHLNTDEEWLLAKQEISKMNGVIPYCLNRGNHDSTDKFNHFFSTTNDYYCSLIDGFYDSSYIENSWRVLEMPNAKYLIITLDYGPSDDVLNWADGVVNNHKDYKVIVTTHAYLYRDGTTLDKNDVSPPTKGGGYNNGDDIWEKFIKKHDNIFTVICGHDPSNEVVYSRAIGDNGNIVNQLLINPQGLDAYQPTGMIAYLYFLNDGKSVEIKYYSTFRKQYLKNSSRIVLSF